jgi:hypothetical protein
MARIKNIEAFCSVCGTHAKMELGATVSGLNTENKRWAKCKKCKQMVMVELNDGSKAAKTSLEGIESQDCTVYSPKKSFTVGESIYHQNWDDFGKVVSKELMSDGHSSILVEFQKSGQKKLIESLTI